MEKKNNPKISMVAETNIEFQKRNYIPPDKYIIETVILDHDFNFNRDGKQIKAWARTLVYDAAKCKSAVPVCFAERKYPNGSCLLSCSSASKGEAVAAHRMITYLLKKGHTPEEIVHSSQLVHQILGYMKDNAENEQFKHLPPVRELMIKSMQATSKLPKEQLQKEVSKIRNILKEDTVKASSLEFYPGTLESTYYKVKSYQVLGTPKGEERQFFTTITERQTGTELMRLESTNKPQAKRMHRMACAAVRAKGPQVIYETLKDNFIPRKKGIHHQESKGNIQERK